MISVALKKRIDENIKPITKQEIFLAQMMVSAALILVNDYISRIKGEIGVPLKQDVKEGFNKMLRNVIGIRNIEEDYFSMKMWNAVKDSKKGAKIYDEYNNDASILAKFCLLFHDRCSRSAENTIEAFNRIADIKSSMNLITQEVIDRLTHK